MFYEGHKFISLWLLGATLFKYRIYLLTYLSDIYEILKKEEEIERQKDEYFEERERQDQLNRIEPVEPDPDYEFEELNNHANELLLNRKRMKKTRIYQKTGYLYDNNAEKINKRIRKM